MGIKMDLTFWKSFPPITRLYLSISVIANFLVFVNLMNPMQIFLNFQLVLFKLNIWRLYSHAFFFGRAGVKTFFYIFFLSREEGLITFIFFLQVIRFFFCLNFSYQKQIF